MSVSQNKKNEQQNNLCTTLTEQWEKGELPFSEYWCKVVGSPYIEQVMSDCMTDEDIVEILDKVPSYTEWQELSKQRNQLIRDVKDLAYIKEENQKLKKLLNECGQKFFEAEGNYGFDDSIVDICSPMIDKITNAIGEKK